MYNMMNSNPSGQGLVNTRLANDLARAREICAKADPYFEKAAGIIQNAALQTRGRQRIATWISIIVGFVVFGELTVFFNTDTMLTFTMIAGIAVGVLIKKSLGRRAQNILDKAVKEANQYSGQGEQILQAHADEVGFLPREYQTVSATSYMLKMVQSGRATTVPAALQMYDEQEHRWRMEASNQEIIANQQIQNRQLEKLNREVSWLKWYI